MARTPNQTQATEADVMASADAMDHPARRTDARMPDSLLRDVTDFTPRMWGPS